MKNNKFRTIKTIAATFAAQVTRTASGASAAAIQAVVDPFRAFVLVAIFLLGSMPLVAQQPCGHAFIGGDETFDIDGYVSTDINNSQNFGHDVAAQADDKIVAVGRSHSASSSHDFSVIRYNPDGSLDNSFGTAGVVSIDFSNGIEEVHGVAIQPNGRIVVVGRACSSDNNLPESCNFAIARLNANGSLDTTFGKILLGTLRSGKQTTDISGFNDVAFDLVLQPDGKIFVGGRALASPGFNFAVVRYNTNGTLDTTFSSDGMATYSVGSASQGVRAMALQTDGKLIAVGYGDLEIKVLRIHPSGEKDSTFGQFGTAPVNLAGNRDEAESVVLQTDGKIIIGGATLNSLYRDSALVRLNPNGKLDTTFNGTGKLIQSVSSFNDRVIDIAVIAGQIYASVEVQDGIQQSLEILYYSPDIPTPCSDTHSRFIGSGINSSASVVSGSRLFVVGTVVEGWDAFIASFETDVNL